MLLKERWPALRLAQRDPMIGVAGLARYSPSQWLIERQANRQQNDNDKNYHALRWAKTTEQSTFALGKGVRSKTLFHQLHFPLRISYFVRWPSFSTWSIRVRVMWWCLASALSSLILVPSSLPLKPALVDDMEGIWLPAEMGGYNSAEGWPEQERKKGHANVLNIAANKDSSFHK